MPPRGSLPLVLLLMRGSATAQEPLAFWEFEDAKNIGADSSTGSQNPFVGEPFSPVPEAPFVQGTVGGAVGSYLSVNGANTSLSVSAKTAKPIPNIAVGGITVELLFRISANQSFNKGANTTLLQGGNGTGSSGWALVLDRHAISFRAAGRAISAFMIGSGVRSYFALTDSEWHHLACRFDAASGEQSIWIDGQCPDPNPPTCPLPCTLGGSLPANATSAPGKIPAGDGTVTLLPTAFDGDLDEIAVYPAALSNGSIYAHYQSAIQQHTKYSFVPVTTPAPAPSPAGGALNASDFPNGTVLPTPDGNSSCSASVMILPVDQLKAFPAPRFLAKPATGPAIGVPQRNFNWMDPSYMSGGPYRNFGQDPTFYPAELQSELATTFHYNLNVAVMGFGGEPSEMESILFGMMDANPSWGVDTIFQRQGTRYCDVYGPNASASVGCETGWRYTNQSLPEGCYLKDASGAYLTLTGAKASAGPTGIVPKILRPTTAQGATANSCPDELFSHEWMAFQTHGKYKAAGLERPVDRINNDGEYNVIYMHAANVFDDTGKCAYDKDPSMLADYKTANISNLANGKPNWYAFVSRWRARFSNEFVQPLTDDPLSPEFKGTSYTEYQIQGTNLFMGDWNETKVINTPVENGGKLRTYSTGDLYPWVQTPRRVMVGPYHNISVSLEYGTPSWDVTHGSWHSIDWLQQILPPQIATGDVVWSPFVAAGWSEQEEINTRPAQWLGFLKLLVVSGAEYFYSGFFSLHPPFPDSRNWIWQAAAPPLAQALSSNWLDVLYNGELMHGDMPVAMGHCAVMQPLSDPMVWVWESGPEHCQLNTSKYQRCLAATFACISCSFHASLLLTLRVDSIRLSA